MKRDSLHKTGIHYAQASSVKAAGQPGRENMTLLPRRFVVEEFIRYNSRKKDRLPPADLDSWDWENADEIDKRLAQGGYKSGIIAGYISWHGLELGQAEFAKCAVVDSIFPQGCPRVLGQLVGSKEFESWKPDRPTEWYELIENGNPYPGEWPFILRPAVESEYPAIWYIEDGSGRGTCLFRRLIHTNDHTSKAPGYLGIVPDANSSFMQEKFPSLLVKES